MKKKYLITNITLILSLLILLFMSLLIMYHAKFITKVFSWHFKKQLLFLFLGLIVFIVIRNISLSKLFDYSFYLYLFNLFLLLVVLKYGFSVNGATAWIKIKNFQIQPSELMKLNYSLFLANYASNRQFFSLYDEFKFLLKVFLIFLLPSILIFLEPDTGAILFLLFITIVVLWNTKISRTWFGILAFLISFFVILFFYLYFFNQTILIKYLGTSFFYIVDRLINFRTGMQIENALIALGSAKFITFNLTTTGIYIPEAPTDFAFSLSSNIFGLAGPILIIVLSFIIDYCLIQKTKYYKHDYLKLFTLAFLTILIFSQIENIGMNLGLLPIIGIPLPFISYGGSCLITLFIFFAIIYNKDLNS